MALAPARLYFGQPAATDTTLYTVSATAGSYVIVKEVVVTNTTATAATVSFGLNGTAATAANQIWAGATSIAANSTTVFTVSTILNASDVIHGLQGTTGALTVAISGVTGP